MSFVIYLSAALIFHAMVMNAPSDPVKILPVGDSITQGGKRDRQEFTYRLPLQMLLHRRDIAYDFVGSQTAGLHEDATWPDVAEGVPFDQDHDGYYGNKTRHALRKTMDAFDTHDTPDLVLIHLGTNDQKHGNFEVTIGAPLKDFIRFLRTKNPEVVVLLGHLNFHEGVALQIREVVEQVAADMHTHESPVETVAHYQDWVPDPKEVYTDTFDWAHPNLKGQEKMAWRWWGAMKKFINAEGRMQN